MSGTSIFAQIFTSLTSYNAVQNHVQSSVIALALDWLQALEFKASYCYRTKLFSDIISLLGCNSELI